MEPRSSHNRWTRPYRRLRRWAKHTPRGEVALSLMTIGALLIVLALVLFVTIL